MDNPNENPSNRNTNTNANATDEAANAATSNESNNTNRSSNDSTTTPLPIPTTESTAIEIEAPTSSGVPHLLVVMRLSETTTPFQPDSGQTSTYTLPSVGSFCCRICQQSNEVEELVSPCSCKGTLAYVHLSCLQRWLNIIGRSYCEICLYRFNTIEKRRYSVCQGLRLWFNHPANRRSLHCNLLRTSLLTFFLFTVMFVIGFGMEVIVRDGAQLGITGSWMTGVNGFLIGTIIIIYLMALYLFLKGELTPWFRWWQRCVSVEIVLDKKPVKAEVKT